MNRLELKINEIVSLLAPMLPSDSFTEIDNMVKAHGEYGVAMEFLCSILEENKIAVDKAIYTKIIELFVEMQFKSDQVNYYKKHLIHK